MNHNTIKILRAKKKPKLKVKLIFLNKADS